MMRQRTYLRARGAGAPVIVGAGTDRVKQRAHSQPDVSLSHSDRGGARAISDMHHASLIELNGNNVRVGGDEGYSFRIVSESDESVTVTADTDEQLTLDNSFPLRIYDATGNIVNEPRIPRHDDSVDDIPLVVNGDESMFQPDPIFEGYTVELLSGGDELTSTNERIYGIGYKGTLSQDSTSGEIKVTFPRDEEVKDSWTVKFIIVNYDSTGSSDIQVEREFEHKDDTLVTTFDADTVGPVPDGGFRDYDIKFYIENDTNTANLWAGGDLELNEQTPRQTTTETRTPTQTRTADVVTTSFEEESIGDTQPADPWFLFNDGGRHEISDTRASDGNQSFYTAFAPLGDPSAIAITLDTTPIVKIKSDIYIENANQSSGNIKISKNSAGYPQDGEDNLSNITPREENIWLRDLETDLTDLEGEHTITFWVDGDNAAYWDNIRISTFVTSTPTDTPTSAQYNFQEGSTTQINLNSETYYVVTDIPEVADSKIAVTTDEYELVDTETTRDVLAPYTWSEVSWPMDWEQELATVMNLREVSSDWQTYGRALDLGWDLTEILVFTSFGVPSASIGPVIEISTDAISWNMEDVERPYREAFQKLTACTQNAQTIRELTSEITSYQNLGDALQTGISASMSLDTAVESGTPLASAASQFASTLQSTGSFTTSAHSALGGTDFSGTTGLFIGFAVSSAVGAVESVIQMKTKVHAVSNAFSTMAIPIVRRLQTLADRISAENGTVGEIYEYNQLVQTYYQMNALHYQVAAAYWQQISNSLTGAIWDVIASAQEKANDHQQTANNMQQTVRYVRQAFGAGWNDIQYRTENSINAEEFGGVPW